MREFVQDQYQARLEKFALELNRAEQNPQDPEAIHDVRVSIRRLMQCFKTFPKFFREKEVRTVRRKLKKLRQDCGEARDCDISIELLLEAGLEGHPAIGKLTDKRENAERDLVRVLAKWAPELGCDAPKNGTSERKKKKSKKKKKAEEQTCEDFDTASAKLVRKWGRKLPAAKVKGSDRWKPKQSVQENAARALPELAGSLLAEGDTVIGPGIPYEDLHEFRIHGKQFRYTLELFAPAYDENLDSVLKDMKLLQDKLGAINDCVTAEAIVEGDPDAVAAIQRLLEQREEDFRQTWTQCFGPDLRTQWKQVLSSPPQPAETEQPAE